jgi:RNA polymerase sigma-70 factor (ECF subfamily)
VAAIPAFGQVRARRNAAKNFKRGRESSGLYCVKALRQPTPMLPMLMEDPTQPAADTAASAVAGGDRAWEEILFAHSAMLYRIAFGVLRNRADAEDAVQDALQRAWRYRARWERIEDPAAWLARIAWRTAKGRRRRITPEPLDGVAELRQLRAPGATAEHLAAQGEMRRLMAAAIGSLPGKLRHPLILSSVEGLSTREVAFILGISESSVRGRYLRARRILREKLVRHVR